MPKKIIIIIVVTLVLVSAILFFVLPKGDKIEDETTPNDELSEIILFYGDECPHCALLEEWLKENQINIKKLEVYHNQENVDLLVKKAEICKLSTDSIGVPFLWTGSDCISGDEPIEDFFREKLNINPNITTNENVESAQ